MQRADSEHARRLDVEKFQPMAKRPLEGRGVEALLGVVTLCDALRYPPVQMARLEGREGCRECAEPRPWGAVRPAVRSPHKPPERHN